MMYQNINGCMVKVENSVELSNETIYYSLFTPEILNYKKSSAKYKYTSRFRWHLNCI